MAYAFSRTDEVPQRKRQISDGTSDIWIFDRTTGKHRQAPAAHPSPVEREEPRLLLGAPATALVQNAFSYSDGSIFPAYYKREALGPIVGDRVPGTGMAVYKTPQLDPRLSFAVAQLGFRTKEGQLFESTEIAPDILTPTEPNFIAEGRDPQLEAAVKALLDVIDGK